MSTYQQITYNFPTNDPHQQSTHFLSTLLWYSGSACGPLKINIFSTSPFFPFPINSSLETGKCLWPTKDQHFLHINSKMHIDTRVIKVADFKSEVIWPMRRFGGRHSLRGHQNGCLRQYAHGYQGNQGCRFEIWSHMTNEDVWRLPWPRRPPLTDCPLIKKIW